MRKLKVLVDTLVTAGKNPVNTIRESLKSAAKEAIGCFPPYTPQELAYAAGYLPVGMWGGSADLTKVDRYMQSFCCSLLRTNIELGLQGRYSMLRAVMIPTICDSLKCVCENWKIAVPGISSIGINYPQNREQASGLIHLKGEFERILGELEKLSGKPVAEEALEESFAVYETWRAAMRRFDAAAALHPLTIDAGTRHYIIKASYFMDKADYTTKITALTAELEAIPEEAFGGGRAVFTGIMAEPGGLYDILAENNMVIVADDLAQESRQFRTPARTEGSVLERLACLFLDLRGCSLLYETGKSRGTMLTELARSRKADVVVFCMHKFCDPEEYDYPVVRKDLEEANVKTLYFEVEEQMESFEQVRTRVQSFMETL